MTGMAVRIISPETNGQYGIHVKVEQQPDPLMYKCSFPWSHPHKKCWLAIFNELQEGIPKFIPGHRLVEISKGGHDFYVEPFEADSKGVVEIERCLSVLHKSAAFIDYPNEVHGGGARYIICLSSFCDEIVEKLKVEAEGGSAKAQYEYGRYLENGCGEKAEYSKEAVQWLTLSAEQGYERAYDHLGKLYSWGRSNPENMEKAFYWFKKAVACGQDIYACYWLAKAYLAGTYCKQDGHEAVRLLIRDATRSGGWFLPMEKLSDIYREAQGGLQWDLKEAYAWALLAARYSEDISRETLEGKRDSLEKMLFPKDVVAGKARAGELNQLIIDSK